MSDQHQFYTKCNEHERLFENKLTVIIPRHHKFCFRMYMPHLANREHYINLIVTNSRNNLKSYEKLYIEGVPGGKDLTSGECSLGQTIPT